VRATLTFLFSIRDRNRIKLVEQTSTSTSTLALARCELELNRPTSKQAKTTKHNNNRQNAAEKQNETNKLTFDFQLENHKI